MSSKPMDKTKEKAPRPQDQVSVFVTRKRTFTLAFLGVALIFVISAVATDYEVIGGLESIPKAVVWMARHFIPDAKAWSRLPYILSKLSETALVSVAVTVCAAICAFFFSLQTHLTPIA